jgi:hypothetical protein
MVSLQECLDLSGLDEDTIRVIAERECVPDIVAAELGYTLTRTPGGVQKLRRFIREDLKNAAVRGDLVKSLRLNRALAKLNAQEHEARAA